MARRHRTASAWAREAALDEGVGPAEAERIVLSHAATARNRVADEGRRYLLPLLGVALLTLAPLYGFAAVLGDPDTVNVLDGWDARTSFPIAAVCGVLGIASQAIAVVAWARHGRRRDATDLWTSMATIVLTGLTIVIMIRRGPEESLDPVPYVVPVAVCLVVALGAAILQGASPRREVEEVRLDELPDAARTMLLDERRLVFATLRARGHLGDVDLDDLAGRPLGFYANGSGR